MAQRFISERDVDTIVAGGARLPEPAVPGAPKRWRYVGRVEGRFLTVIAAHDGDLLIVVTTF